jgi:nucleoside-diphosphate-sugar epimerase
MDSVIYLGDGPLARSTQQCFPEEKFQISIFSNHQNTKNYDEIDNLIEEIKSNPNMNIHAVIISWRSLRKCGNNLHAYDILLKLKSIKVALKQVIYLSSVSVYGSTDFPVSEKSKVLLENDYASEKYKLEGTLIDCFSENLKILRISNVYGSDLFDDFPNRIIKSIQLAAPLNVYQPESIFRDYISIKHFSGLFKKILDFDYSGKTLVINVASGHSMSLQNILSQIQNHFPLKVNALPILPGIIEKSLVNVGLLDSLNITNDTLEHSDVVKYILNSSEAGNKMEIV